MTRAKDISKILTDADISGTLDVSGAFTSLGIDDNANAVAITIDSSEQVGIGTTSPTTQLDVTSSGNGEIAIISGTSGITALYMGDSAQKDKGKIFYHNGSDYMAFNANGAERIRIDSSGNVGIGQTSNLARLTVNSGATNASATFISSDAGAYIGFADNSTTLDSGTFPYVFTGAVGNDYIIGTNNSERMRIDSSGNVLIGKSSVDSGTVGVEFRPDGLGVFGRDGNFPLIVNRTSNFGGSILFRKDGSGGGFIAIFEDSSAGRLLLGNDNTCLLFNDSTKQIIPFQSTGAKQDDVIALGNASGRFDQVFSANGSLNTSDRNEKQDIEELTDAEKRVAVKAKSLVRKYRWKKRVTEKGDNARTHVGVIAQDLQDAFTAEGLDATKYGMFCSDTWWDNDEVFVDDDGKEHNIVKSYYTEEEAPKGSTKKTRLAVRYSELLAFIISTL